MTRIATGALAALSALVVGLPGGRPAAAAQPMTGYVGQSASSVAGCPFLIWRLVKHDDGAITGIVYYSDLSGLSMAKGNITKSGQFQLQLTSALGEGPVGTVQGTRPKSGKATATMTGAGCANMVMQLSPVDNLNRIPLASQTGYKG